MANMKAQLVIQNSFTAASDKLKNILMTKSVSYRIRKSSTQPQIVGIPFKR